MSKARVLEFGNTNLDFGNLEFPELELHLERYLRNSKSFLELQRLIKYLNPILRGGNLDPQEQAVLTRIRQRAYDKKRSPKFKTEIPNPNLEKSAVPKISKIPEQIIQKLPKKELPKEAPVAALITEIPKPNNFLDGVHRAIKKIDGEKFAEKMPALLFCLTAATLSCWFIWQQSLELYTTAGFANSTSAAMGGLLMVVGFTAYFSLSRSVLAFMLCLYASGYEAYLMVSGTIQNEHAAHVVEVQSSPELVILNAKAEKNLAKYNELKERHQDPGSKVYKNGWFEKTHLAPAWSASLAAHEELSKLTQALSSATSGEHVTWLKIFYRLGLVFLCMIFVHRFFNLVAYEPKSRAQTDAEKIILDRAAG